MKGIKSFMYRYKHFLSLMYIVVLLSFSTLLFGTSQNITKSTIILPVEANLSSVEDYLNKNIPDTLSVIHDINKTCIKPQYLKTKGIPKCKMDNFKISCKKHWIKIQTIPEIKCDIEGWVKRDGKLKVSGDKKTLKFAFPIKTKILVTSKHLDAEATAAATVYLLATPKINHDWSITIDVKPTFTWSKEPTVTLLKGIEINIKKQVEAKLQKRIQKFMQKLPKHLEKIRLKEKMAATWNKLQEPIKLDKRTQSYLYFTPHALSYSGFRIVDNLLQTTMSIQGDTDITLGTVKTKIVKTPLPDLNLIPFKEGEFTFNLPISISYKEFIEMLNKKFIDGYKIDFTQSTLPGFITLTNPKIKKVDSDKILISAHIHYDNNNTWLENIEGEITFQGSPKLDKETQVIHLDNLSYSAKTNSDIFDGLVNLAEIKPLQYYLSHLMTFALSDKINKGIAKANRALKLVSKKRVTLFAKLHMATVENLHLYNEKLTLTTKLSGVMKANIDLEPN